RTLKNPLLSVGLISAVGCYVCLAFPTLRAVSVGAASFPTVVSVGFALMLPWAAERSAWRSRRLGAVIGSVARWSYSMYLVNIPASVLVYFLVERNLPHTWGAVSATLAIYLSACVGLGALSWRMIERPFMQLRERLPISGAAAPQKSSET